jgi:hypothetical protein
VIFEIIVGITGIILMAAAIFVLWVLKVVEEDDGIE